MRLAVEDGRPTRQKIGRESEVARRKVEGGNSAWASEEDERALALEASRTDTRA